MDSKTGASEFVFGHAHIAHTFIRLGFGNGYAKPSEVDRRMFL
jgi:hypothetical protein